MHPILPKSRPWWGPPSLLLPCAAALTAMLLTACPARDVCHDSRTAVPTASSCTWANWSRNLVHKPAKGGDDYYFAPTSRAELLSIVKNRPAGTSIRVSGQRHAQPPLIAEDNRSGPPPSKTPSGFIIDLSCYSDLGDDGKQRMVLDAANHKVTVNAGVREDELDAFLTAHDMMLKTVTAGGFFSIGGMTAVDVHGATQSSGIFAETASAFTIMGHDGEVRTIDASTTPVGDWSPLQFARVSMGALGIVTSVTIDVRPRPYMTSLNAGRKRFTLGDKADFVKQLTEWLGAHDSVETFWNPYSDAFNALYWTVDDDPADKTPNRSDNVPTACSYAVNSTFGAPLEGTIIEPVAEAAGMLVQSSGIPDEARGFIDMMFGQIDKQLDHARDLHNALWLTASARVMFMGYFVELPDLGEAGLAKAWDALQVVRDRLQSNTGFLLAGPIEFRFIQGGDTALASTYTKNPGAAFINIDVIGFVTDKQDDTYPHELLAFFADLERAWNKMGGLPHNGKMYGFHDPTQPDGFSPPFNPKFLEWYRSVRSERIDAFEAYRSTVDPDGVFCNAYLSELIGCAHR